MNGYAHNPLRVGIASLTCYHTFDLTHQMKRLGQDPVLFTGYPRWKLREDLRPYALTHPSRAVLWKLTTHFPHGNDTNLWSNMAYCDFGRWMARKVGRLKLDVFEALEGVGLEGGRVAQDNGAVWICNRPASHMLTQKELVEDELKTWRQPMPRVNFDPVMVDRALREYDGANGIIVPSHFAKRSFIKRGFSPDRVFVCPYGVDVSMFSPQPKQDQRFRVLFVGNQSLQKGIGYLFEAVRPLVRAGLIEVWLIGRTAEDGRAILERNRDLFTHQGLRPRSELAWFYSQGSVLIQPSIQEGLAMVQPQAMACGTPVIATYNAGAEDLFTDGVEGFIVPPRSPEAIRERIQFLLDNPQELARMRQASLDRVSALGGWDCFGERALAAYRQLVALREERQSVTAN